MSRVRSRDTRLELTFRKALWGAGVRGWRCHVRSIHGTPDLAWRGRKVAVFVDSAWWHGHSSRWQPGRLPKHWDDKIRRNKARDEHVNQLLTAEGWKVLRLWDFEIQKDLNRCVRLVSEVLTSQTPLLP
jgi:DNA mismatch endonuclease, patch repair protein